MEIGEIWSEFRKRRVRVLYVSPNEPGKHATIAKALLHAKEHDRIEVASGQYNESVLVNKDVEIVGGDGEPPEICYRGTILSFTALGGKAIVSNLDFIQQDRSPDTHTVHICEGTPHVVQCRFSSVYVTGSASPTLIANTISGSPESGITLRGEAGGRFAKNRVHSHEAYCIDIDASGEMEFIENRVWAPPPLPLQSATSERKRKQAEIIEKQRGLGLVSVSGRKSGHLCRPRFVENYFSDVGEICLIGHGPFAPGGGHLRTSLRWGDDAGGVFAENDVSGGVTALTIGPRCSLDVDGNVVAKQDVAGIIISGDTTSKILHNRIKDCGEAAIAVHGAVFVSANVIYSVQTGVGIAIKCARSNMVSFGHDLLSEYQSDKRSNNFSAFVPDIEGNVIDGVSGHGISCEVGCAVIKKNEIKNISNSSGIRIGESALVVVDANSFDGIENEAVTVVRNLDMSHVSKNSFNSCGCALAVKRGSNPFCSENVVTQCARGIHVMHQARGTFIGNSITQCEVGVIIEHSSNPFLFRNSVVSNERYGVLVRSHGCGVVTTNTITSNRGDGVYVCGASDPELTENNIHGNGASGISVTESSSGSFVKNRIYGNAGCNCVVSGASQPTFRANHITTLRETLSEHTTHTLADTAASFSEASGGVFEKNTITGTTTGITLTDADTAPLIRCNVFQDIATYCIKCEHRSAGLLAGNIFTRTRLVSILVSSGAAPVVSQNSFVKEATLGILVTSNEGEATKPSLLNNVFRDCEGTMVHVHGEGADPHIAGNFFENNAGRTVAFDAGCGGTMQGNDFRGNQLPISISDNAAPEVKGNSLQGSTIAAIQIFNEGKGEVSENSICGGNVGVVSAGYAGEATLRNNHIAKNNFGVRCFHSAAEDGALSCGAQHRNAATPATTPGRVTLSENEISGNAIANIVVEKGGFLTLHSNTVHDSPIGILVREGGTGRFLHNSLSKHKVHIQVIHEGNPFVEHNTLRNGNTGVDVSEHGKGDFQRNILTGNTTQVNVHNGGDPTMRHCEFNGSPTSGIVVKKGGKGTFCENVFRSNAACGVEIEGGASPHFAKNAISNNAAYGILLHDGATAALYDNTLTHNAQGGLKVGSKCELICQRNTLTENLVGMIIANNSTSSISENIIDNNKTIGIQLEEPSCGVLLFENRIVNERIGVRVDSGASGTSIGKNRFHNNLIAIDLAGNAVIIENHFEQNKRGICAHSGCEAEVHSNLLLRNTISIEALHGAVLSVCDNQLKGSPSRPPASIISGLPTVPPDLTDSAIQDIPGESTGFIGIRSLSAATILSQNRFSDLNVAILLDTLSDIDAPIQENSAFCYTEDLRESHLTEFCAILDTLAKKERCMQIYDNHIERSGVGISSSSDLQVDVKRNTFLRNDVGLRVVENGTPFCRENVFTHCVCAVLADSSWDTDASISQILHSAEEAFADTPHRPYYRQPRQSLANNGVIYSNKFVKNGRSIWMRGSPIPEESVGSVKILFNRFERNEEGMLCCDSSHGIVDANLFEANTAYAVAVQSKASPLLRRNVFYKHSNPAVVLSLEGAGVFAQNAFFRNHCAVSLQSHSTTSFTQNCFVSNTAAVKVGHSEGELLQNTFDFNVEDVLCGDGAKTVLKGNSFQSDLSVRCTDNARAEFSANFILGAVSIEEAAFPSFTGNVFALGGVTIGTGSSPSFSTNTFYGRGLPSHISEHNALCSTHFSALTDPLPTFPEESAAMVTILGSPRFLQNHFLHCNRSISALGGEAVFTGNNFYGGRIGVEIKRNGRPVFGKGNCWSGQDRSILVSGEGTAACLEHCEIFAATHVGVTVESRATPQCRSLDIYECKIGLHIARNGAGSFEDCNIFDNTLNGVVIDANCTPTLSLCRISTTHDSGALHRESGSGTVEDCKIKHQFTPLQRRTSQGRESSEEKLRKRGVALKRVEDAAEKVVAGLLMMSAEQTLAGVAACRRWGLDVVLSKAECATSFIKEKSRERTRFASIESFGVTLPRRSSVARRTSEATDWASVSMSATYETISPTQQRTRRTASVPTYINRRQSNTGNPRRATLASPTIVMDSRGGGGGGGGGGGMTSPKHRPRHSIPCVQTRRASAKRGSTQGTQSRGASGGSIVATRRKKSLKEKAQGGGGGGGTDEDADSPRKGIAKFGTNVFDYDSPDAFGDFAGFDAEEVMYVYSFFLNDVLRCNFKGFPLS